MSQQMTAAFLGRKLVLIRRWDPSKAIEIIKAEGITTAGGVPAMAMDILATDAKGAKLPLEELSYGGAPAAETLPDVMLKRNIKPYVHSGRRVVRRCLSCLLQVTGLRVERNERNHLLCSGKW